jgi:Ca2+-binding RTX toxin-like protein
LLFGDAFTMSQSIGPGLDLKYLFENGDLPALNTLFSDILGFLRRPQVELTGIGDDTIRGGSSLDLIIGGGGNDQINSGGGLADVMFGNEGDDTLRGNLTRFNVIVGGEGSDILSAANFTGNTGSLLVGDTFDFPLDFLELPRIDIDFERGSLSLRVGLVAVGNGNDHMSATSGFNVMIGGDGSDTISGGNGFDFIMGDAVALGLDFTVDLRLTSILTSLYNLTPGALAHFTDQFGLTGTGLDQVSGGAGSDVLIGGSGNDLIAGETGLDFLFGNDGDDNLLGGGGLDFLFGGLDDDYLEGGDTYDVVFGGEGRDRFKFRLRLRDYPHFIRNIILRMSDYDPAEDIEVE